MTLFGPQHTAGMFYCSESGSQESAASALTPNTTVQLPCDKSVQEMPRGAEKSHLTNSKATSSTSRVADLRHVSEPCRTWQKNHSAELSLTYSFTESQIKSLVVV